MSIAVDCLQPTRPTRYVVDGQVRLGALAVQAPSGVPCPVVPLKQRGWKWS